MNVLATVAGAAAVRNMVFRTTISVRWYEHSIVITSLLAATGSGLTRVSALLEWVKNTPIRFTIVNMTRNMCMEDSKCSGRSWVVVMMYVARMVFTVSRVGSATMNVANTNARNAITPVCGLRDVMNDGWPSDLLLTDLTLVPLVPAEDLAVLLMSALLLLLAL